MKRLVFLCVLMAALSGCGSASESGLAEGEYNIFYLNSTMTGLYPVSRQVNASDAEGMIEEMMYGFRHIPQDIDAGLALDEKVTYKGFQKENGIVYLYFDSNYADMKPVREILCRAALAKTLTQIEGVDFVSIYSGEQPLTDSYGRNIGLFSGSDFYESITDVNSFEKTELTLYFSDTSGEKLKEEKREVFYNANTSMEKLVMDELMSGPTEEGLRGTIPSDTALLGISVSENTCYINFDEGFLRNIPDEKDYISIYSIVNSMSELTNVNKVQILINGSKDNIFKESIPLTDAFERNLDYVE